MRFLIALFVFVNVYTSIAQSSREVIFTVQTNYLIASNQSPAYVLVDKANVREQPVLNSSVVGQLTIGTPIYPLKNAKSAITINGVTSDWYYVEHLNATGWVWGGTLAQSAVKSSADLDVLFLHGIQSYITDSAAGLSTYTYSVKAVKKDVLIDELQFKSPALYYERLSNPGNLGVKNVDDILTLHIPCEGGCGCTTGNHYFFWNKGKFQLHEILFGSPDGDYSESTNFVFPQELKGLKNFIIKSSDLVDWEVTDAQVGADRVKRLSILEYYVWDGKQLIPSLSKKKVITSSWINN